MIKTCLSYSYIIQKQKDPTKAHQVKLEVIVKALKWLEMDMDVDEVLLSLSLSQLVVFLGGKSHQISVAIFVGRVYNVHTNIQESCERVLRAQEQSGSSKQARSIP